MICDCIMDGVVTCDGIMDGFVICVWKIFSGSNFSWM